MDPIYEEFRDMAEDMLDEFGATLTLLKPGATSGPPHRPTIGPPSRHTIRAFRTSKTITSQADPRLSIVKDTYIISTVGRIVINEGDQIETAEKILTISTVREISPVGMTIIWFAQVQG